VPKVLIIDYDPRAIKALCDPIEESGYIVVQSTDGRQGLLDYIAHKPDLVIVEAMIPKRNGFDLCTEIRKKDKDTPVIIVSSVYKGRRYRSQAIHQCGANDFLEKPIDADALIKQVDLLTGGAQRAAPAVVAASGPESAPPAAPAEPAAPAAAAAASSGSVAVKAQPGSVEQEITDRLDSILGD